MKRSELIFKTIDKMSSKELKELLNSKADAIKPYKSYISLKLEERSILDRYFKAG